MGKGGFAVNTQQNQKGNGLLGSFSLYMVQLKIKNQTLEAHKHFFVRRLVFYDRGHYNSIKNLKEDIFSFLYTFSL